MKPDNLLTGALLALERAGTGRGMLCVADSGGAGLCIVAMCVCVRLWQSHLPMRHGGIRDLREVLGWVHAAVNLGRFSLIRHA